MSNLRIFALGAALAGACHGAYVQLNLTYPFHDNTIVSDPNKVIQELHEAGINDSGQGYSWSISGMADLETGVLKAKAQNNNSVAGVMAILSDRVMVTGSPSTAVTAIFEMDVDGHSTINTLCECFSSASMVTYLQATAGPQNVTFSGFDYTWSNNNIGEGGTEFWKHDAYGSVTIRDDDKGEFDFTLRIALPFFVGNDGLSNNYVLTQFLHVKAEQAERGSAAIDAWDTARLRVILPDGYSLKSESGLLLTKPYTPDPAAVPEPATGALCLLGAAVLALGGGRQIRSMKTLRQ